MDTNTKYLVECGSNDSNWTTRPYDSREEAEQRLKEILPIVFCSHDHYVTEYKPEWHGVWDEIALAFNYPDTGRRRCVTIESRDTEEDD